MVAPTHSSGSACPHCLSFAEENGALHEEVAGLMDTTRRQGRQIVALKNELKKARQEDPKNDVVLEVLEHWATRHPRARIPLDGKRAQVIKHALKLGHTVDDLKEALDGLAKLPYVGPHGRQSMPGKGAQRYDDVEHALRDEATIERFRGYAQDEKLPMPVEASVLDEMALVPLANEWGLHPHDLGGGGVFSAKCPAHDDPHGTLSVVRGLVVTCWAGCNPEAIAHSLGAPLVDAQPWVELGWRWVPHPPAVVRELRRVA